MNDTLTLDTLFKLVEQWKTELQETNPFICLAKKYEGDLISGSHILIVPESWFIKFPELIQFRKTKGVKVSKYLVHDTQAFLLKVTLSFKNE